VEEFDRQLDTAAATVRPLMSVLGDRRRGQALLDDAKSDQEKRKVASLLQTQQGVQILKLLAKVIDEQLVSTVTASLCAARVQAQTVRAARSTFAEETNRSSRVNVWEGSGQLGSS
jgi:poly-D-alanine transfer protein DltD